MRDSQSRREWTLLIAAILANVLLCIVLVTLFGWAVNQAPEPEVTVEELEEEALPTAEPTRTETQASHETTTPTIPPAPTPTAVPTLAPMPTPEPTRRQFSEPTKPPYVFPTPIHIPPVPRASPAPTRAR